MIDVLTIISDALLLVGVVMAVGILAETWQAGRGSHGLPVFPEKL